MTGWAQSPAQLHEFDIFITLANDVGLLGRPNVVARIEIGAAVGNFSGMRIWLKASIQAL